MLILNIFTNQIRRYFVPHTPCKKSIIPKLPSPQLLLHLWKLLKYHPRRYTLQYLNNLRGRIPRWDRQKYMHMIFHHFLLINLKFIPLRYPLKYLLQPLCQLLIQYHFSILWHPNQMVLQIVNCSSRMPQSHTLKYTRLLRSRALFIPPASWGVFKGCLL